MPAKAKSKKKAVASGPTLDELGDMLDGAPVAGKASPSGKYADVSIPEKLAATAVTPRGLAAYRAKLHAFFAPHVLGEAYQAIRKAAIAGDLGAIDKIFKAYGVLADGKSGVNINVQQTNENRQLAVAPGSAGVRELTSPDAIYRQLAIEREQRALGPGRALLEAEATPVDEV